MRLRIDAVEIEIEAEVMDSGLVRLTFERLDAAGVFQIRGLVTADEALQISELLEEAGKRGMRLANERITHGPVKS